MKERIIVVLFLAILITGLLISPVALAQGESSNNSIWAKITDYKLFITDSINTYFSNLGSEMINNSMGKIGRASCWERV